MSAGYRLDAGKVQYSLIPPDALEGMARVLTWACTRTTPKPYPPRNWEAGMAWSRCFDSLMRHAWAYWRGEDLDPESKLPHVDHMQVNCAFLASYFRRPWVKKYDDRYDLMRRYHEADASARKRKKA